MPFIRLDISVKQFASIKKGRKIRLTPKHMTGGGIVLSVDPANFDRITRCFALKKGLDISLSPKEVYDTITSKGAGINVDASTFDRDTRCFDLKNASMKVRGGSVNRGKKAEKWLDVIEKTYDSAAKRLKPVVKPITEAGTNYVVRQIDPYGAAMNDAEQGVDMFTPFLEQRAPTAPTQVTPGQNINYIQAANIAAVQENASIVPYQPKPAVAPPTLGTVTPAVETPYVSTRHTLPSQTTPTSSPVLYSRLHGRGAYLQGRGTVDGRGARFPLMHPALFSNPQSEGFLQHLPQQYRDAVRLGAGLYL